MSTRSTTHFVEKGSTQPTAIIYRHWDGYPEGAGAGLIRFLDECEKLKDNRFSVPSYLAAKYVVFLAREFAEEPNTDPLNFLSVGVVDEDPGDIAFRYVVRCSSGRPEVKCYKVGGWGKEDILVSDWPK